jgi:outer membrane lipoprotein SlyB
MLRTALVALAVSAAATLPLAASAQYAGDTLMTSQTVIAGTLEQSISSKTAQVGDPFVLDVTPPFPADDQRYSGAHIYGHVAAVNRAGGLKKGAVQLAFDRITLIDGTTASLTGAVLSIETKQGGSTAGRAILGAVIGDVLGNYVGKHLGTNAGGAIGAVGGGIYAASLGTNVVINQGTNVSIKTTAPSTVLSRRQPGYPGQYNNGYNNGPPPPNGPPNNGYPPPPPTPYPTPYH